MAANINSINMKKLLLVLALGVFASPIAKAQYCTSGATSLSDSQLAGIDFKGDNNTALDTVVPCSSNAPGLIDFTGVDTVQVTIGNSYWVGYEIGTCGGNYTQQFAVYADLNRDTVFQDSELLGYHTGLTVGTVDSIQIEIPWYAQAGQTRIRIVNRETSLSTPQSPCGTFTWGSTHDYILDVQGSAASLCTYPVNLMASGVDYNQASFSWYTLEDSSYFAMVEAGVVPTSSDFSLETSTSKLIIGANNISPNTSYDVYVYVPCGGDTAQISFTTLCSPVVAPYSQNFDGGDFYTGTSIYTGAGQILGDCFEAESDYPYGSYEGWLVNSGTTSTSSTGPGGDASTYGYGNYMFYESSYGTSATLSLPTLDVSALSDPFLSFDYHYYGSTSGKLRLKVSNDQGLSWIEHDLITSQGQTSETDPYKNAGFSLAPWLGDTAIRVQLEFVEDGTGGSYSDFAIDNISVDEAPACYNPVATLVGTTPGLTTGSADFAFLSGKTLAYSYTEVGSTTTLANGVLFNNSYSFTGLAVNKAYEFSFYNICTGSFSDTTVVQAFVPGLNPCAPQTAPYIETFEITSVKRQCWSEVSGADIDATWYLDSSQVQYQSYPNPTLYNNDTSFVAGQGSTFARLGSGTSSAGTDYSGEIQSGVFDLSALSSLQIDLLVAGGYYSVTYSSGTKYETEPDFYIDYRTSSSGSWNRVLEYVDTIFDGWTLVSIDEPIIDLSSTMEFRFGYIGGGLPIAVDSISFKQGSTCVKPVNLTTDLVTQNVAQVSWTGIAANYSYDAGIVGQSSTLGGSTSGDSVVFSGLSPKTTYWITVSPDCGTGVASPVSDTLFFSTDCDEISTFPTIESFESNSTWELCYEATSQYTSSWTQYGWNLDKTGSSYDISGAYSGNQYAWAYWSGDAWLVSPVIDASSLTTLEVEFYYFVDAWVSSWSGASYTEELIVEYRLSPSDAWTPLFNDDQASTTWKKGVAITPATSSEMQIRFTVDGGGGDGLGLDYITFDEGPTCLPVSIASIDNITDQSATVEIDGPAANYEVYLEQPSIDATTGLLVFAQATGTSYLLTQDSIQQLTSLTAESIYGVWVREICSPGDTSDWSSVETFTTLCAALSLPYTESFESSGLGCWTTYGSTGWDVDKTSSYDITSAYDGDEFAYANWTGVRYLESPLIDASTVNTLKVDFYYWLDEYFGSVDELIVEYRLGSNDPWVEVFRSSVATTTWTNASIVIGSTSGTMQVRFTSDANYADGIGLDAVTFEEGPFCPDPANVTIVPSNNSAVISWDSPNNTNQGSRIEWGAVGFAQGTGSAFGFGGDTSGVISPFTLNGLSADSVYWVYIQDSCSVTDSSSWVGPIEFRTTCDPRVAPYHENFSSIPSCWDVEDNVQSSATFANWNLVTSQTSLSYAAAPFDHTGDGSGAMGVDGSYYYSGGLPVMTTEEVDVSGLADPVMSFYLSNTDYAFCTFPNTVVVDFYDGSAWHDSAVVVDELLLNTWKYYEVDMANYTISGNVMARFTLHYTGQPYAFYSDVLVDDVTFDERPTCYDPVDLTLVNTNANDADFVWTSPNSTGNWLLKVVDQVTGNTTYQSLSGSALGTITGLSGGTAYCVGVAELCTGDTTFFSNQVCFTTQCGIVYAPYAQDFAPKQYDFNCWSRSSNMSSAGSGSQWEGTGGDWMTGSAEHIWGNTPGQTSTYPSTLYNYAIGVNGSSPFNAVVTVESPEIDVTSLVKPRLEFHTISGQDGDTVVTWLGDTISNGQNTLVVDMWDGASWNDSIYVNASDSVVWDTAFFELNQFNITGPVKVRFTVHKTAVIPAFDDVLLDNFSITDDPAALTCTDIDTAYAFDITCADAMISWGTLDSNGVMTQGSSDTNRIGTVVYLGTDSVDMMANAKYYTSDTALYVDGLLPGVDYYFWAMDSCISGNTSKVIGSYMFTAATAPLPILPTIAAVNDTVGTTSDWTITLTGDTTATYTWDINGTSYNGMVITPSFTSNGTVTATLTVTNDCGSVDTTIAITVTQIGLEELALDVSNIYPNPSNGAFNVEFTSSENLDYRIELMDAMGRLVSIKEGRTSHRTEVRFDTNLPAGVYIVKTIVGKQMNIDRVTIRR